MRGESLIGRALAGIGTVGRNGHALNALRSTGRGMSGIGMTSERVVANRAAGRAAYRTLKRRGVMRVGAGGAVIGMGLAARKTASGYKQYQGPPSIQGLPTQSPYGYG